LEQFLVVRTVTDRPSLTKGLSPLCIFNRRNEQQFISA
jgi:hypothetical protein